MSSIFVRFPENWIVSLVRLPSKVLSGFFVYVIIFYQRFISPFKGTSCRFYPTCSHYSLESIKKYGLFRGVWLTVIRISKCHPFHAGGYDPVK